MRKRVDVGHEVHVRRLIGENLGFGIGAGHHLAENRFRQAQRVVAQTAQEFVGRQDLAARDAGHVGHEALDLADAARLQPVGEFLFDMAIHGRALSRTRCAEAGENRARDFAFPPAPFGMPLQAEKKTFRARHRNGFDRAVGRDRVGVKRRRQPVDALRMQRIHLEAFQRDELRQQSAVGNADLVCWTILHVEMRVLVLAMIEAARELPARADADVPPNATFNS